jgi:putative transposase
MGSDPIFPKNRKIRVRPSFCLSSRSGAARFTDMARAPRIFVDGVPSHVAVRGNNGQLFFAGDGDRLEFLHLLREASLKHGVAVHAYVLMSNHFHLLVTGRRRESIGRTIQGIGRKYVPRFNRHQGRTGALWERRYFGNLVDSARYALTAQRYIELNPCRAKMVRRPSEYIWSSYLHHAHGKPDDLLVPLVPYLSLSPDPAKRMTAYRRICDEPLCDEELKRIRDAARGGWALGDEAFCTWIEGLTQSPAKPRTAGRPRKPEE